MASEEEEKARRRIECWRRAAPVLEEERIREIRASDTAAFIRMTAGLVAALAARRPESADSGLVAQQRRFHAPSSR